MRKLITLLFIISSYTLLQAQLAPEFISVPPTLHCVKNETSNQISIQWSASTQVEACFEEYGVYMALHSRDGDYNKVASIPNSADGTLTIDPHSSGRVYIYMTQELNCEHSGNTELMTSDTLDNLVPQPAPVVRKITVENGQPVIYWEPSTNPEVTAYAIFSLENGYNTAIDTVYGRMTDSYTDATHAASDSVAVYKIRSIEFCEDPAGLYSNITAAYNTMKLTHGEEDLCKRSIDLEWNGYNNITPVHRYLIEHSLDYGASFQVKDSLAGDARHYLFEGLQAQATTHIRIVAVLSDGERSWSNVVQINSQSVPPVEHHYIRNITVRDDHVELLYVPDPNADFQEIALERSTTGELFSVLTSGVSITDPTGMQPYIIKDFSALTGRSSLHYRVSVKNVCSDKFSTLPAKTILLEGQNLALNNELQWSDLSIDENEIVNYELHRVLNNDTSVVYNFHQAGEYLDKNVFTTNSFEDACYFISAQHFSNDSLRAGNIYSSISNTICMRPTPTAFVPNAFAPQGYNRVFKPRLVFASDADYSLEIFDRHGNRVFKSDDPQIGWDGTYHSKQAALDSYIYHLRFTGLNDVQYKKSGYVVLVQ